MSRILKAVDLFCGAGGTSQGAEQSGAAKVICAVNHWQRAVETHSANFPDAKHINSRLDQVNPGESDRPDILFASPECTHHSRARGGKPTSDQQRSGAWDLMRWIEYHRPSFLAIENVVEFKDWGPVDLKTGQPIKKYRGKFFSAWTNAIESAGYRLEVIEANGANYGAATSRTRLFVLARLGNRRVPVPEPTHAQFVGGELPGMGGLKRWRSAAEIIDWSIPCPSVFLRATPLADKTLYRIAAGLRKFVGPFLAQFDNKGSPNGSYVRSIDRPLHTLTTKANAMVAVPFQYQNIGLGAGRSRAAGDVVPTIVAARENHGVAIPFIKPNFNERDGQAPRSHDLESPLPTVTSRGAGDLAVPFVVPRQGPYDSQTLKRCRGTDEPLNTITASHIPGGVAVPYLTDRNNPGWQLVRAQSLNDPSPTITTGGGPMLTVPYAFDTNHGDDGHSAGSRTRPITDPLATVSKRNGQYIAVPFVVTYYANGKAYSVDNPLCTLSTRDRCGLAMAIIETAPSIEPRSDGERHLYETMVELGVRDLGYRMLINPELSLAMGFPGSYIFRGNKGEVTKQIGNAVVPDVAEAITNAFAGAA